MSDLPPGWAPAKLEDCVDILDSRRAPLNADERAARIAGKSGDELYPYYGATGLVGQIDAFLFDEPLILLGEDGAPFLDLGKPKAYTVDGKCWVNNHAHVLRAKRAVSSRGYIAPYLNAFDYRGVVTGSTRLKLTQAAMRTIPVPLAPRNEQARIASKLELVLGKVDSCRERLDRVPQILKKFREAVLEAAVSGRLTEEWRRERTPAYQSIAVAEPYHHTVRGVSSWIPTNLGEMCDFVGGSQPAKSTFQYADGPDFVRLIQIRDYKSDKHKTFIPRVLARRFCNAKDVMIGRYGPPIFQILRGLEGAYNVALMKAVPKDSLVSREYLYYLLKGSNLLRFVEAGSDRTAGQDGVRKEQLEGYPAFRPPLTEQAEIVRRITALLSLADGLQRQHAGAMEGVAKLTPSVLAKAFRGELVPQDPNDEPAGEMLERVRSTTRNTAKTQLRDVASLDTRRET